MICYTIYPFLRAPSKNKAARKKNKPNVIIYKSEDTLEWTDIPCIYCGREITIAGRYNTLLGTNREG